MFEVVRTMTAPVPTPPRSNDGKPTTETLHGTDVQSDVGPAFVFVVRLLGIPAEIQQLRHAAGNRAVLSERDILRSARDLSVRARFTTADARRLATLPMPVIALLRDGRWVVVGRPAPDKMLVQDPTRPAPEIWEQSRFEAEWTGRLLLVAKRFASTDISGRFGVGWFVAAVRKYRQPLFEVLFGSLFLQIFALLTPLFFQVVVDKVLVHRGLSTLAVLAIGLAAMSMFEVLLTGIRTWLFAHTTNRIDVELGARVFKHLFSLPMAYFASRRVGDTVARIRELETIRQFLTSSALTLVLDVLFSLIFIGVLFLYSSLLAWVVVASVPIYGVISLLVTPTIRARVDEKFRRGAENQSFLVESVSGAETVKSMALEPAMQRRWEEQLAAYVSASFSVVSLATWSQQAIQAVGKVVTVVVLYLGAREVITGSMTIGELVAFNMLSNQVSQPILRLAHMWQDFQQTRVSIDRIGDVLNTAPEPATGGQANLPAIRGAIDFEKVTFRYRLDTAPTLSDIDLHVAAGEVVGIVGASGSGKSTLVKLVQRLYVPESGRIQVDGIDVKQVDPSWLRRQLGVVLQESVLFNRTVRENIAVSDPTMDMNRVVAAARLAGAHDFVSALPQGYDTMIGERGATLSGGQRQRIAIARALVSQPRILIFDEATAALDYESEAAIQKNMAAITKGRTVLIVAHRLSTVRNADRIVVLREGRIVEQGDHDSLVAGGGVYARLWQIQSTGSAEPGRGAQ